MLYKLFFLFVVIPLAELILLMMLADLTNWKVSVALVLVSGFCGAYLARQQGVSTWQRIRLEMSEGRMPTDSLIDAGMIFFAGGLLLTPGVITDLFGISLLIPVCRGWYKVRLARWFKGQFVMQTMQMNPQEMDPFDIPSTGPESNLGQSQVIDSYVIDPDSPDEKTG